MNYRILVVDDDALMREYVEEALRREGYFVETASGGQDAVETLEGSDFDAVVTDLKMTPVDGIELVRKIKARSPKTRSVVMTAYGTIETAVSALKEGADDYLLKPFSPDALSLALRRALERGKLDEENAYLRTEVNTHYDFSSMVGTSAAIREVHEQVQKVADSPATVLIRGESGTGKELVARAIHYGGCRRSAPFVKVNCAALSAGLLESELFGHERGSFTGAHERRIGRFELADGGTLLLDEVSEISAELQPKLLRALQEREFERVGGSHTISVDTRIVATSNMNLERAVEDGRLRNDLFFRLNVIPVKLPPLRERKEDIPALMDHFLHRYAQENGKELKGFTERAYAELSHFDWPGNVRELENAVERAVVLSSGDTLDVSDFNLAGPSPATGDGMVRVGMTVAEAERELILKTLERCKQNRTRASEMLGISVRTLRNKLNEYRDAGIIPPEAD